MISQSKNVQWYKNIHFNRVFSHFCFSYSWASDVFETFWRLAKWFRKNKCFEQKFAIFNNKIWLPEILKCFISTMFKARHLSLQWRFPAPFPFYNLVWARATVRGGQMMPCSTRLGSERAGCHVYLWVEYRMKIRISKLSFFIFPFLFEKY